MPGSPGRQEKVLSIALAPPAKTIPNTAEMSALCLQRLPEDSKGRAGPKWEQRVRAQTLPYSIVQSQNRSSKKPGQLSRTKKTRSCLFYVHHDNLVLLGCMEVPIPTASGRNVSIPGTCWWIWYRLCVCVCVVYIQNLSFEIKIEEVWSDFTAGSLLKARHRCQFFCENYRLAKCELEQFGCKDIKKSSKFKLFSLQENYKSFERSKNKSEI